MIMDYLIPKMQSKKKKIKIIYLLLGENLIKKKNLQYMNNKKGSRNLLIYQILTCLPG